MIIANPIYDTVFKYMMQNNRIARYFIETLLEEQIDEVIMQPQEMAYPLRDDADMVTLTTLVRFDFVATIRNANGEHKKILIEIQKARHFIDLLRFRNYLGMHYSTKDAEKNSDKQTSALPIVTIYLLGFTLPEIETPVLKVANQYIDQIRKVVINLKSDFVERLTHECHVVQIPRIEGKLGSKLEDLMSIFEQANFVENNSTIKEYKYPIHDERIQEIADKLNYIVIDRTIRKEIDAEQEAYRVFNLSEMAAEDAIKKGKEAEIKAGEAVKEAERKADEAVKEAERKADEAVKEAERKADESVKVAERKVDEAERRLSHALTEIEALKKMYK